jgi:hypothetical protein
VFPQPQSKGIQSLFASFSSEKEGLASFRRDQLPGWNPASSASALQA